MVIYSLQVKVLVPLALIILAIVMARPTLLHLYLTSNFLAMRLFLIPGSVVDYLCPIHFVGLFHQFH